MVKAGDESRRIPKGKAKEMIIRPMIKDSPGVGMTPLPWGRAYGKAVHGVLRGFWGVFQAPAGAPQQVSHLPMGRRGRGIQMMSSIQLGNTS